MDTPRHEPQQEPASAALKPLDVNGVVAVVAGTVAWLVALIVLLIVDRHSEWVWICVTGAALGLVGIPTQARYQRRLG
jgi:hypothetical protein